MIKQKSASFTLDAELRYEKKIKINEKPAILIAEDIPEQLDTIARAGEIIKQNGYVAYVSSGNKVTLAASNDIDIDLVPIAKEIGKLLGGSGGGKPKMAQAGGKIPGKKRDVIEKFEDLITT
jgi:alanyl-tRNA synthetase